MTIIYKVLAVVSLIYIVPCGLLHMGFASWVAFGIGWLFVIAIGYFLFANEIDDI